MSLSLSERLSGIFDMSSGRAVFVSNPNGLNSLDEEAGKTGFDYAETTYEFVKGGVLTGAFGGFVRTDCFIATKANGDTFILPVAPK